MKYFTINVNEQIISINYWMAKLSLLHNLIVFKDLILDF